MQKKIALTKRALKCRRGATALEFGLLAPLFFVLLMGVIEISVIVTKMVLAENSMRVAGRNAILSQVNAGNGVIETTIQQNTFNLIDNIQVVNAGCNNSEGRNCLCVVAYANAGALAAAQAAAVNSCPGGDGTATTAANAVVLYQLRYRHTFFTPLGSLLQLIDGNAFPNNRIDLSTSTIVKNEPF